jgi:hypothetical protein
MKAVVRVALAYFTFAPLQKWLAALGVLLVAIALVVRAVADEPGGGPLMLSIFGAIFIVLGPMFGGGVMLRIASSRPTMMLRPGARLRLLLGTTLALNIVVLLATLPFLLDPAVGPRGERMPSAADVFAIAWGAMALNWAGVFTLSALRFGLAFVWIVPVIGANLPRFVPRADLPEPATVLIAGLILWGAFAVWYLRSRSHRPMPPWNSASATTTGGFAFALPFRRSGSASAPPSPPHPRQLLHGEASLFTYVFIGAGQALMVVILFTWLVDRPEAREKALLGNLLFMALHFSCFGFAYWLVGRCRVLWLRAGLDRAGLLRHAEATGLLPMMVSTLTATAVIIVAQGLLRPDLLLAIALNALAQLTLAACLAYWGLSFTRSWSVGTTFESVGAFLLGLIGLIALGATSPPMRLVWAIALLVLFALLLRARALRRWRTLDWRVKRPRMNQPLGIRGRT